MKLTGKCKEDFEKWYSLSSLKTGNHHYPHIELFYKSQESMQYGVYVDFFDSVGIYMCLGYYGGSRTYRCRIETSNFDSRDGLIEELTLSEARKEAIEKANEILNKNIN